MASNTKSSLISIIIPSYNEEVRLGRNLDSVIKYLNENYSNSFELIIVDDGSTDSTAKVVSKIISKEPKANLISYTPNRGKGYAVRRGVMSSKGGYVLFMDADLSTPLTEIPHILKMIQDADIVIGSRGRTSAKVHKRPSLFRKFASYVFDQIKYSIVGLRRFKDTQCGFKAYKGDVARKLFSYCKVDRFMFDVEVLFLAERAGMKIIEMPVNWADVPGSKVKFLEGVINMFRDLWRIRQMHTLTPTNLVES